MINNDNKINEKSQYQTLQQILYPLYTKLNNLLPSSQQVQITQSIESLTTGINKIVQLITLSMQRYQKHLQALQQNMRKHIKNQIQLKLYYQYLQQVVAGLKKQKSSDLQTIQTLKTQITALKQKQKTYITLTYNNTKNNQQPGIIDTITKIKNRLSLNNTGQFYANYLTKKIDKQQQTLQLRDKRQSLANSLKHLCGSPLIKPQNKNNKKQKSKTKFKHKHRSNQKSNQNTQSNKNNKSRQSLSYHTHQTLRNSFKQKLIPKDQKKQKQKSHLKQQYNKLCVSRNSKS